MRRALSERHNSGLLLIILLLGAAILSIDLAAQDSQNLADLAVGTRIKVFLEGDRELDGTLVEVTEFTVKLKHKFGVAELRKGEIRKWERFRTVAEVFEERAAGCTTAVAWCNLGDWADAESEADLAARAYREAIRLDSDFARAHEALGEVKVDGEWLSHADAMRKQGKEYYKGEWRTPEEIAALELKEEQAARTEKLKGRKELELEYAGRPWAAMDPIETDHYYIHCNSTLEVAREYADVMEALYEKYDSVFTEKNFPRNSRTKSTIRIHANHQQFMDWTGNGPGIGGFYRPALRDVTAYHGSFGTTGSTREVLAHEGTHQFEGLIFKNMWALPAWFIEGLAVYFGDGSKISPRKVEINEIPRDRLIGLQGAIENGSYCELRKLLRIPQPAFGGFFYGHGWGVLYWCLYGNKMGAWKGDVGENIMTDWLIHCKQISKNEGVVDLEKEAQYFEELIVRHTKMSIEKWEAEYKEWILGLPVEKIGRSSGNRWSSEALKLEVQRPSGWQWIKESDLASDEVVAAKGAGSQVRRVSTYCWSNWQHSDMNLEYASRLAGNIFQEIVVDQDYEAGEVSHYPAIRATYSSAKRVLRAETSFDDQGRPSTKLEAGDPQKYEVVFYGSIDKVYCNVFECQPDVWEAQYSQFEKYLESFKIDN